MGISSNNGNVLPSLPIGTMVAWPNAVAPYGWLSADGTAVSRTGYPDLFALYGTKYGVGDGSTTFNMPSIPLASTPWTAPRGRIFNNQNVAGTQDAVAASTQTDLTNDSVNLVAGRRYRVHYGTSFYSPAGASNFTLYLLKAGTIVRSVEMLPSSTAGRYVESSYEFLQATTATVAFKVACHFAGATGVVLNDGTNNSRGTSIIIEDVGGDITAAPFSTGSWIVRAKNVAVNIDASTYSVATSGSMPAAVLGRTVYVTDTHRLLVADSTTPIFRPPWNLPWGMFPSHDAAETALVGVAAITANTSSVTTQTDVSGLTLTWTAVKGRRYLYLFSGEVNVPSGSSGAWVVALTDGSNTQKARCTGAATLAPNTSFSYMGQFSEDFASTQLVTRKIRLSSTGSAVQITASATVPAYLHVIDIGPISAPA